ncbi:MaoC family dehydratase [Neptunomonas japonica]|uniref:MaoC family dehydratase n=1 Tax=Neptunomonas japonica JAMM 1380 TaxID=1441457 RepID=A0A7R6PB15_9GAMM|nr:MaoC family dehydratase [Neptunomonas japonica]BBB30483.1 MaoC family dehydratase [Neptunomonas japonica JAMM 1380]
MTDIKVGTEIPSLKLPPISRHTLALYCGASGDHNPIHVDSDFALKAGMSDVFAHGMLSMAYLGRMLTNWKSQSQLRKFSSRFAAITHLRDVISCGGKVVEIYEDNGETLARLSIVAATQKGDQTLIGEAIVAL